MAAVRGIFSISDAIFLKKNNYWTDLSQVWVNSIVNTGYFVSGRTSVSSVSNVDKIFYSTDTTSSSASSFVPARTSHSTLGSLENGYIFGGFRDSPISTSYKLSFSTDVTSLNPLMTFTQVDSTATGNTTSGYIAGGQQISAISKVTYSTDTLAPSPSFLTNIRYSFAATGSETAGYFSGGNPSPLTSTDKLTYSTDNVSGVPGASLYFSSIESTASGNSTAGYNGNSFFGTGRARLCKIIYSTDTTNGGSTILYYARSIGSTGNSESGYFSGGNDTNVIPSVNVTTMNKLSYSTDTMQNSVSGRLSSGRYAISGVSARNNSLNIWRRFSDGTTTTNSSLLPPVTSTSQTTTSSFTPLSLNVGYFGGGRGGSPLTNYSTMDKLNYTTDTTEPVPNANLSAARYGLAATGNSIDGYFGGGGGVPGPAASSIMDKLTYSTDTTVRSPAGSFTDSNASLYSATGNSTAGYFAGGRNFDPASNTVPRSSIYKITYGGDLLHRIPASLSDVRQNLAATGNSTAGYFGGGSTQPAPYSTMDKVTYSTDTTAAVPGAALSAARHYLAATGNSTAGYFGGGQPFPSGSNIDTLTYSTDTREAVPGISLTTSRSSISATGNSTAGYFSTDKITYASNTVTLVPTAALSVNRPRYGASSPRANALPENIPAPVIV